MTRPAGLDRGSGRLSPARRPVAALPPAWTLPIPDVADARGIPVGTVRSRLFYARQQLQALLSDYLQ